MSNRPAYQRIADELRAQILDGTYGPGDQLPSRAKLSADHQVSDRVAFEAIRVLVNEGFVETRSGSGAYVRAEPKALLMRRNWANERPGRFPLDFDLIAPGHKSRWESHCESSLKPPPVFAERLGLTPDETAMKTTYLFLVDGEPDVFCTSWERQKILLDNNTAIVPARTSNDFSTVVERLAAVGVIVTDYVETHSARAATTEEARLLDARAGMPLALVKRTYYVGELAVETADVLLVSERCELSYEFPVRRP